MGAAVRCLCRYAAAAAILSLFAGIASAIDFPGPDPGPARAAIQGDTITLENNVLRFTWSTADGRLKPKEFVDKLNGQTLSLAGSECFQFYLDDSPSPASNKVIVSDCRIQYKPTMVEECDGDLRRDTNPRQTSACNFGGSRQSQSVELARLLGGRLELCAGVDGDSVVDRPVACSRRTGVCCVGIAGDGSGGGGWLPRHRWINTLCRSQSDGQGGPIAVADGKGTKVEVSQIVDEESLRVGLGSAHSVIGVVPRGQLRRGFLYYLERERAHPYRPFLHYNNGSEIGCEYWGKKLHKSDAEAEQFPYETARPLANEHPRHWR